MNTVFDFTVKDRKGNAVPLRNYANEVLLIVNTAIKSEFTPQYAELEALYEKYHAQGFAVLDFPSNQPTKSCPGTDEIVHNFAKESNQPTKSCPGTDEIVHNFAKDNYNTEFPRFKKVKVNGDDAEPLYKYLKEMKEGDITADFTKFLINKRGYVVARFEPTTPIAEIDAQIAAML